MFFRDGQSISTLSQQRIQPINAENNRLVKSSMTPSEHKATYWAVTDDEDRLGGYSGYERATVLFNEQLGDEDKESWHEHAPSEPHPSVENEQ